MRVRSRGKVDRPTVRMPFLWYRGTRYKSAAPPEDPPLRSRRNQRDLRAPVAWPIQAVVLALRGAVQFGAASIVERGGRVRAAAFALPLYGAVMKAEEHLERREAQRLRLTPATAPRMSVDLSFSAVQFAFSVGARLRGFKVVPATPPVALAQQIIAEIERRRSWRAALDGGRQATPYSRASP